MRRVQLRLLTILCTLCYSIDLMSATSAKDNFTLGVHAICNNNRDPHGSSSEIRTIRWQLNVCQTSTNSTHEIHPGRGTWFLHAHLN